MTVLHEQPGVAHNHARRSPQQAKPEPRSASARAVSVAVLTGGGDKPYVLGITEALTKSGIVLDLIGSNDLLCRELTNNPQVKFFNLRGDQNREASFLAKALRILIYYGRLLRYAATAEPKIFHVLWNNKFELFDRTLLMAYYKLMGKKIVMTAHNVNVGRRDGNDSFLNRLSLKIQYALCDHIFVHTKAMKEELKSDFGVMDKKASVIPFGINNTVPNSALTRAEARRRIGVGDNDKTLLFYGNIAPYKGLEYLISALSLLNEASVQCRLIIAGRVKQFITAGKLRNNSDQYWNDVQSAIAQRAVDKQIVQRIEFIPDDETEQYFKAADALVLPYMNIFQSGVLFLGYSFGLPVIATNVGSLKDEIVEGRTGFVCNPKDPAALANAIKSFFASDLFNSLEARRQEIKEYANDRYSWSKVAAIITGVYGELIADGHWLSDN